MLWSNVFCFPFLCVIKDLWFCNQLPWGHHQHVISTFLFFVCKAHDNEYTVEISQSCRENYDWYVSLELPSTQPSFTCSKSVMETPGIINVASWNNRSGVFIVKLNRFHTLFWGFQCWVWTSNCCMSINSMPNVWLFYWLTRMWIDFARKQMLVLLLRDLFSMFTFYRYLT